MKYVTTRGHWKRGVSERRYELILKKLDDTATSDELAELEAIDADMEAYHKPKWDRRFKHLEKILKRQQHAMDTINQIMAAIGGLDIVDRA